MKRQKGPKAQLVKGQRGMRKPNRALEAGSNDPGNAIGAGQWQLKYAEAALDHVPAGVLWIDENEKILYANKEVSRLLGYTEEDLLTKTLGDLDAHRPSAVWQRDWLALRKRGLMTFESSVTSKNSIIHPVYVTSVCRKYDGSGYVFVIILDPAEGKKAEDLLKLTQFSVDNSAIPAFWLDKSGQTLHVNKATCSTLGYSEEELRTMNVRDWDVGFPYYKWNEFWPELKKKHSVTVESIHKRKDGTQFPVELAISYLRFGAREYMFVFAHDLTEKKLAQKEKERLQTQLFHAQKMEAVGQLAGGVAHDFNNILTALIGYGTLLEMEMPEDDPLRLYVTEVLSSAEKAANLTQSLLAFSRKQTIDLKPYNLHHIINGIRKLIAGLIMEDIELKVNLADWNPIMMADLTQIDQVIINLATNARDAMPEGGVLTIETRPFSLDYEFANAHGYGVPGKYVVLSVSDTGMGMDERTKARIFDPFFTTKEVGKGTGLGLSIVYGIVEQHGGHVVVHSKKDQGTRFDLYFPLISEQLQEAKPALADTIKKGSETILLAENNTVVRRLARDVLERTGYTVIEAANGKDAIETFVANNDKIDFA
ncbi:MAG TPA: PAS domain S-box protein, partial [Syntrophorhabdaceae bacterium]|nr:PAS domain S-box protein [Syntrophorhabdaceae bacterium]